jgi:hypothetical protein
MKYLLLLYLLSWQSLFSKENYYTTIKNLKGSKIIKEFQNSYASFEGTLQGQSDDYTTRLEQNKKS